MKIVVYGIGGVGGYFGGKLAQTTNDVTFIARGTHLKAIQKNGLHVKSIYGDFSVRPTLATAHMRAISSPELIILAVKSWQIEQVAAQLKPILTKDTMVLPLQNGADTAERLSNILHKKHVLAGLCRIISFIGSPGHICHKAIRPQILFGDLYNQKSNRLQAVKTIFDTAGIDADIPEDIHLEVWRKFLFIVTISGIGALTRMEIGSLRSDTYIRNLMIQTAAEIVAVANAKGIGLDDTDIEKIFVVIDQQMPDATASMQRDIMEGKPSELDNFNGYIVNQGQKYGIATPINTFIYHCLLPMEKRSRKV